MSKQQQETIDNLHEKIIIQIDKDEYNNAYKKAIKNAAKNIVVPGFRKGNAPIGMLEKMHGTSVFFEEAMKLGEEKLFAYIKDIKIEIIYQPLLLVTNLYNLTNKATEVLRFEFEIGLKPKIDLEIFSKLNVDVYDIAINDDMINNEVGYYQNHYAKHENIKQLSNKEKDYLKGYLSRKDADKTIEGNKKAFNIFTINILDEAYQNKYLSAKEGDLIAFDFNDIDEQFKQKYADTIPFHKDDKEDIKKMIYDFEVEELMHTIDHELNVELFKLVMGDKTTVSNEIEFKEELNKNFREHYRQMAKNHAIHLMSHDIMKEVNFDIPKTFIKKWVESQKNKNEKDHKELSENDLADIYKYVKERMLHDSIIEYKKLKVSHQEVELEMRQQIISQFGQYISQVNPEMLKKFISTSLNNKEQVSKLENNILTSKVYDYIYLEATKKTVPISLEDFNAIVEKHNKEHHSHEKEHNH